MDGWIKLHRELLEKPIWKQSTMEQKIILITLLCMVNHDLEEWEWKGKKFVCRPGQVVTSLEKIREKTGAKITIQNVRTALNRFEKLGFLTNESTKTGRLVTIANWEVYQGDDQKHNKKSDKEVTKGSQSTNKDLTPNKNDKNDKNDKKYIDIYIGVPEPIKDAFLEFSEMRTFIKKPIRTVNTVTRILNKLDKLASTDEDKIAILNQSTDNGWQDVYALKGITNELRGKKKEAGGQDSDYSWWLNQG